MILPKTVVKKGHVDNILEQDGPIIVEFLEKSSIILSTNPSARAGYDTRSIFKRSLTGLNSEFSFS